MRRMSPVLPLAARAIIRTASGKRIELPMVRDASGNLTSHPAPEGGFVEGLVYAGRFLPVSVFAEPMLAVDGSAR
jgi:hypothetical protein